MYLSSERKVQNQVAFEKFSKRWELSWEKKERETGCRCGKPATLQYPKEFWFDSKNKKILCFQTHQLANSAIISSLTD